MRQPAKKTSARPELTRWTAFYAEDSRLVEIGPSRTASYAADVFRRASVRQVLDLGCGTGRDSAALAAAGLQVIGADAARPGLYLARQRRPSSVVAQTDARRLPYPAAVFQGVYCFGLLHEFEEGGKVHDPRRVGLTEFHAPRRHKRWTHRRRALQDEM